MLELAMKSENEHFVLPSYIPLNIILIFSSSFVLCVCHFLLPFYKLRWINRTPMCLVKIYNSAVLLFSPFSVLLLCSCCLALFSEDDDIVGVLFFLHNQQEKKMFLFPSSSLLLSFFGFRW
mgnify:CR=1 FL=1